MTRFLKVLFLSIAVAMLGTTGNPLIVFAASGESANWAGYVADQGEYTAIQGSWVVPRVVPTGELRASAEWIGIGGIHSDDLIQTGTEAITANGSTRYIAWYEILPAGPVIIPLHIHEGDHIKASLELQEANLWKLDMANTTTGKTYSTLIRYASSLSSAEWIEERPKDTNGFLPLAHFTTVRFTNAVVTLNGITQSILDVEAKPLRMVDKDKIIASPSAIASDRSSFSVSELSEPSEVRETMISKVIPLIQRIQISYINNSRMNRKIIFITL